MEVTAADGSVRLLKAKHVLIATGGVATAIPMEGAVREAGHVGQGHVGAGRGGMLDPDWSGPLRLRFLI